MSKKIVEKAMGLNDLNWNRLFDKYNILDRVQKDGVFRISATQIKEFREPRLMTKFDHAVNLPQPFRDNHLTILPMTRGSYLISHFDAYHPLEELHGPIHIFSLPEHIQSLDSSCITSEAIALNCAVASGVIGDFLGEEDGDLFSTVSGRMGSSEFSFYIRDTKGGSDHRIQVNNAQIEIDAAYEGLSCLALVEAKMDLSNDFLIRQLYYPFRVWESRVTKPVRPVFLIYSNGIFHLYEYSFTVKDEYNSLKLVRQRDYSVEDVSISASDIQSVLDRAVIVEEPETPFPQADSFERVINLCELADTHCLSKSEVTETYDFDVRQTNYYTDAARYLGLLNKVQSDGTICYQLNDTGRRILHLGYRQRQLEYCQRILAHSVFHQALTLYFQNGTMPSKSAIVDIMKLSSLRGVQSDETFTRRASTVKGWLNWIVSLINE